MSTHTKVTNFYKQSGFLAHPVYTGESQPFLGRFISCADRHLSHECNLYKNYIFGKIQDGDGRHLRFWIFGHLGHL